MRLTLAIAAVSLALTGCFNFDKAYENYCARGHCDAGSGGGEGGGAGGGGGGGGGGSGTDGGEDAGTDAGPTPCLPFGASCTAVGQCCEDGGAMGCSRFGYCQPRPRECHEDGYKCGADRDCCSGKCASGACSPCGRSGASCNQAANCCVGSHACGPSNTCESGVADFGDGYQCVSADFCASSRCDLTDAGPPPTGRCAADDGGCVPPKGFSGTKPCCSGLVVDAGVCCLPEGAYCSSFANCCSGTCYGWQCVAEGANLGDRCLGGSQCQQSFICDLVSHTCTDRQCVASRGCCTFSDRNGLCDFGDGGSCGNPAHSCNANSDCCSDRCSNYICD